VAVPPVSGLAPEAHEDLYPELNDARTAWGEIKVTPTRHYITY
jgi:hypothetical protein